MTEETKARIFDPFFTTKFTGRGLGLSATIGILRSHNGGLRLKSEHGQGTSFIVYLPACASTLVAAAVPDDSQLAQLRAGSFALLVDDEAHVRETTTELLAKCGLRVQVAQDGAQAVELFRRAPARYDVILLDMTMPRLSGEETAALLREIRPDIRILFISGYNRRELVDTLENRDRISFLQKPFALDALRKELTVLLN
jgi:CheY-like chemotaxis protein